MQVNLIINWQKPQHQVDLNLNNSSESLGKLLCMSERQISYLQKNVINFIELLLNWMVFINKYFMINVVASHKVHMTTVLLQKVNQKLPKSM